MIVVRYSNDTNIYVESRSPMHEKKLPVIAKAAGVYRHPSVARNLENPNARTITESLLSDDYDEALRLLEEETCRIYQILSSKGGLTVDEWELIKSSLSKGLYMFPDIILSMGTSMRWQIANDKVDAFLRSILNKHGQSVDIINVNGGSVLYDDENAFLKKMAEALCVNMDFETIERDIDSADYSGTKKRLHYITIYDFLKYHFDKNDVPSKSELISILSSCKDKTSANIIAAKDIICAIQGDFWQEYEKYRDFKMLQVLARWYGKSTVRSLSGEAYNYFANNIDEDLLSKALSFMKVHTAYVNKKRLQVFTTGSVAKFNFEIEKLNGDIFATVCENSYTNNFFGTSKKLKVTSTNSLQLTGLDYGKTYCVSLWEVMGNSDAMKLVDLPSVTPGIKWPVAKSFSKNSHDKTMTISLVTEGGEGDLSYVAVVKKGKTTISSPQDGIKIEPANNSDTIIFSVSELTYKEEYTFCVYALLESGKYFYKIISDFKHIPEEAQLDIVVRKPDISRKSVLDKDIYLDFIGKSWPEAFGNKMVKFACRDDRFPENFSDGKTGFVIKDLSLNNYKDGLFKLSTPKEKIYSVIYICGWLESDSGEDQLVVRNAIYSLVYKFKKNIIRFDTIFNKLIPDLKIPLLRVYCFDKNDNIVYANENVEVNESLQFTTDPTGKISSVVVDAANSTERQLYQFRNGKNLSIGKSKV